MDDSFITDFFLVDRTERSLLSRVLLTFFSRRQRLCGIAGVGLFHSEMTSNKACPIRALYGRMATSFVRKTRCAAVSSAACKCNACNSVILVSIKVSAAIIDSCRESDGNGAMS